MLSMMSKMSKYTFSQNVLLIMHLSKFICHNMQGDFFNCPPPPPKSRVSKSRVSKSRVSKLENRNIEYRKVEIWKSRINKVSDTTYISDVAFFKIVNNLISVCVGFWFSNFDCHFFAAGTINLSKGGGHIEEIRKRCLKKQKKTYKCQFSMYVGRQSEMSVFFCFFPNSSNIQFFQWSLEKKLKNVSFYGVCIYVRPKLTFVSFFLVFLRTLGKGAK